MLKIVYSSVYGSSKAYAEALASRFGAIAEDVKDAELGNAEIVVHFGGLYAGTVSGLKKVYRAIPENAELIVVTVGLADPGYGDNKRKIESDVSKIIPPGRARLFHVRGRMDYSVLSAKHRAMMWMLVKWIKSHNYDDPQNRQLVETYGDVIDFVDFGMLDDIEKYLKERI